MHPAVKPTTPKFGPALSPDGATFRLWAPRCDTLGLRLHHHGPDRPMQATGDGWFELFVAGIGAGADYSFVLPDGTVVPDAASRFQPADAHGPSRLIDPDVFAWTDAGWTTPAWHEAVFYELHVGTFTPEGTYLAAIDRLDHLVQLGITAIQLLPLADFPGRFNWGYDGVCLYAPDATYGTPDELRALVDAAHARGLMVFFDVVYNHFGPDGNFIPRYAPMLSDRHDNDYGDVPHFDGSDSRPVRDFVIGNVLYWFEDFHVDGLRFDAIHAIVDHSRPHVLEEIAEAVHDRFPGKHLVVENSENEASWLKRDEDGNPALFTAQWSDDIHHCLHVIATGDRQDYYDNYQRPLEQLGRGLTEGYVYQGEYRKTNDSPLGEPSAHLPPTSFIAFLQNHDQVGNRPCGDRLSASTSRDIREALATVYLLSPTIPLIFMGEEFEATAPFPYFTDIGEWLHEPIRQSRRDMLAEWPHPDDPPDPFDENTFRSAKLDWNEAERNSDHLALYRDLIATRRTELVPRLDGIRGHAGRYLLHAPHLLELTWALADETSLRMLANLGPEPARIDTSAHGRRIWLTGREEAGQLAGWSVVVMVG